MALVIIPGDPSANSYVSEAEADTYFENRLYSDAWNSFVQKEQALILSTSMIDWYIDFIGYKTDPAQALDWPRTDAIRYSGVEIPVDEIPPEVKTATYELTLSMIESDVTQDWDLQGFKKVKADVLEIEVDGSSNNPAPNAMPDRIYKILSDLTRNSNTSGVKVIRLGRA